MARLPPKAAKWWEQDNILPSFDGKNPSLLGEGKFANLSRLAVDGLARWLRPEGYVEAAQGIARDTPVAAFEDVVNHLLPQALYAPRVLADNQIAQ